MLLRVRKLHLLARETQTAEGAGVGCTITHQVLGGQGTTRIRAALMSQQNLI